MHSYNVIWCPETWWRDSFVHINTQLIFRVFLTAFHVRVWRNPGTDIRRWQSISTLAWRAWVSNFLSKKRWGREAVIKHAAIDSSGLTHEPFVTACKTSHSHHNRRSSWIRLERDHNLHHENTQRRDFWRIGDVGWFGMRDWHVLSRAAWLCSCELSVLVLFPILSGVACGIDGMQQH